MSELIPATPDTESAERHFWDDIIRCLEALSNISEEFDLFWSLENLKDEDRQAGYDEVYGNFLMATVPEGQSSDLSHIEKFLQEAGLLEEGENEV